MSREVLFATGNPAKLAQLADVAMRLGCGLAILSAQARHGDLARYEEIGADTEAIARAGALAVAARIHSPVLAEDTAFYVDALGGEPGVFAGRYLKQHGRAGILAALQGRVDRRAWIVSALAWADPTGRCRTWVQRLEGSVTFQEAWAEGLPGWIAPGPGNSQGGGYNAIFIPQGEARTLAQIPPDEALIKGYREPNFAAMLRWLTATTPRGDSSSSE